MGEKKADEKSREEKLADIRKKAKELEKKLKAQEPIEEKKEAKKEVPKVKAPSLNLFGRWSSDVEVIDPSLKNYINLKGRLLPRSAGIYRQRFHKSKMHILERMALHLMVPGHLGRKHKLTSGKFGGGFNKTLLAVEKSLEIMEEKEKKNPVEIFVRALENAGPREEIMSYQLGSIVARDAVVTAPQRRIDKALRLFAQGAYRKSFSKKKSIEQALAEEILAAYHNSSESLAIKDRERMEREASGAR